MCNIISLYLLLHSTQAKKFNISKVVKYIHLINEIFSKSRNSNYLRDIFELNFCVRHPIIKINQNLIYVNIKCNLVSSWRHQNNLINLLQPQYCCLLFSAMRSLTCQNNIIFKCFSNVFQMFFKCFIKFNFKCFIKCFIKFNFKCFVKFIFKCFIKYEILKKLY